MLAVRPAWINAVSFESGRRLLGLFGSHELSTSIRPLLAMKNFESAVPAYVLTVGPISPIHCCARATAGSIQLVPVVVGSVISRLSISKWVPACSVWPELRNSCNSMLSKFEKSAQIGVTKFSGFSDDSFDSSTRAIEPFCPPVGSVQASQPLRARSYWLR